MKDLALNVVIVPLVRATTSTLLALHRMLGIVVTPTAELGGNAHHTLVEGCC